METRKAGSVATKAAAVAAAAAAKATVKSSSSTCSTGSSPPGPDSTCAENPSLLEALEKLLDVRFTKLYTKMEGMETKIASLSTKVDNKTNSLEQKLTQLKKSQETMDTTIIKCLNERNAPTASSPAAGVNSGGFFSKKKLVPGLATSNNENADKFSVSVADATEIKSSLATIHHKIGNFQEHDVSKMLNNLDQKLDDAQQKIHKMDEKMIKYESDLKEFSEVMVKSAPDEEMRNLVPKIVQLQTNLDFLLTGESETNALIDTVIPTINKLQKDIETFTTAQNEERTKMKSETIPKILQSLDDIYDKTKDVKNEVIDNSEDILDKTSKVNKGLDDLKFKLSRMEENVIRIESTSRATSEKPWIRKSYSFEEKSKDDRKSGSESDTESEKAAPEKEKKVVIPEDVSGKDIMQELYNVNKGIEQLGKEIRKVDVLDLVEERVIPNVYTIRKNLEHFMAQQSYQVPAGSHYRGVPNRNFAGGRTYYGKYAEDPSKRKRYEMEYYRGRRGMMPRRNIIPGTKWTYDEHGNREQASDEEHSRSRTRSKSRSRSRSQRRSSRSRSRSRDSEDSKSRERKHKERSTSPDSEDGEIQIMEKQINKIAISVDEIQGKMDSWLKYSKKMFNKSDANTDSLYDKIEDTTKMVIDKIEGTSMGEEMKDKIITDVHSKLCEFGSMFESLTSELSQKIDKTNTTSNSTNAFNDNNDSVVIKLDDVMNKMKKSDSYIKSIADNCLKLISVVKRVEQNEKTILHSLNGISNLDDGEGTFADFFKLLKQMSPRLDDLYIKILPILEDIKSDLKRSLDKGGVGKREDSEHIQKILDLVEDIKEEGKIDSSKLTPTDNNMLQVFNALNELKIIINNKETNTVKNLNEMKSDNIKILGKLNELYKNNKPFEKMTHKILSLTEELRKDTSTDAKTLSQINTVLQGLKASGPAYENKILNAIKGLKGNLPEGSTDVTFDDKIESLIESLNALKEGQVEIKTIVEDDLKTEMRNILHKSKMEEMKKRSDDSANIGKILGVMEKKLVDSHSKDHRLALNEIKKTEKNVSDIRDLVQERVEQSNSLLKKVQEENGELIKSLIKEVEENLVEEIKRIDVKQTIMSPIVKAGPASKRNAEAAKLLSISEINTKLDRLDEKMLKETDFKVMLEELTKYHGLGSEILNSVEDLKLLTSSTPNALHDIVPKIEKINSVIVEIPNDINSAMAATEENLCLNLDAKIKEQHQLTLQEVFEKFDLMESRMAVIKKYAKHGPSGGVGGVVVGGGSVGTPSGSVATSAVATEESNKINVRQMNELRTALVDELRNVSNFEDVKSSLDTLQATLIPLVEDIRAMDKQIMEEQAKIMEEQAKGLLVEDQLEALCNTILQPLQDLKPGVDEIKEMMINSAAISALDGHDKTSSLGGSQVITSTMTKIEERLTGQQAVLTDLMEILKERKESENFPSPLPPSKNTRVDGLEKRIESRKKLTQHFKKVQDLLSEINLKSDQSIELEAKLNEYMSQIFPDISQVRSLLENISSSSEITEDRGKSSLQALDQLCEQILQNVKGLTELSHQTSEPRSQSINELNEFVRFSVPVMKRLLKDDADDNDIVQGEECYQETQDEDEEAKIEEEDDVGREKCVAPLAENPFFRSSPKTTAETKTTPNVSSKSTKGVSKTTRKRKVGPKSVRSDYVDEGGSLSDGGSTVAEKNMQPVVKLTKSRQTVAPIKIKRSHLEIPSTKTTSSTTPATTTTTTTTTHVTESSVPSPSSSATKKPRRSACSKKDKIEKMEQ